MATIQYERWGIRVLFLYYDRFSWPPRSRGNRLASCVLCPSGFGPFSIALSSCRYAISHLILTFRGCCLVAALRICVCKRFSVILT